MNYRIIIASILMLATNIVIVEASGTPSGTPSASSPMFYDPPPSCSIKMVCGTMHSAHPPRHVTHKHKAKPASISDIVKSAEPPAIPAIPATFGENNNLGRFPGTLGLYDYHKTPAEEFEDAVRTNYRNTPAQLPAKLCPCICNDYLGDYRSIYVVQYFNITEAHATSSHNNSTTVTTVPEPSCIILFLIGLAGLYMARLTQIK